MAHAHSGPVQLHWEETGEGPAVLLVMGLGMNATGWWRTVPVLARSLRVIAFDNRGVGRSDQPPGPYTTAVMADDAIAVLDAAGAERAHVYGISLGGMIAQEIALRHPARVDRLVLGATTPGGILHAPADEQTQAFFARRATMPVEEAVWASVPYNYAAATRTRHADRIAEDIEQRLMYPVARASYEAQLAAAREHDASDRIAQITAPTLVVHGSEDVMIVPDNGRRLAEHLPSAELWLLEGAGHLYPTDDPGADARIAGFLAEP